MKNNIFGFLGFITITILIFVYISKVFFPALNSIGGYENEAVGPTTQQAMKASGLIFPVILIFIATVFLYYHFKITGFNKIIYPIIVFTFYWLFIFMGVAQSGSASGWMVIITFIPAVIVFLLSIILGWRSDKKHKN